MPLDRKYGSEFRLINTNENIKNVDDYEILDIYSRKIYIDDELIIDNYIDRVWKKCW